MYRNKTVRLVPILFCLLAVSGCERRDPLVEQHLLEFGTIIKITLITPDLNHAEDLLEEIESRLKTWRNQWHAWEDSDLTRFNQKLADGMPARIPDSLQELIQLSRHYHDASNGLFNPALGKLIAAYGFHGANPDYRKIESIKRNLPNMQQLVVQDQVATSQNPDLQLDLGGIAKGYAIGLIAAYLDSEGIEHYIVNAGGDLMTAGNRYGRPWRIGIQNPYAPGTIAGIEIEGRYSLFTSGNYQRQYSQGDKQTHHIIDPRSGESSSGQSSATVLMRDPIKADVAATVLMIDGFRQYRSLTESLQFTDFLLLNEAKQILVSRSMLDRLQLKTNWPVKIVN